MGYRRDLDIYIYICLVHSYDAATGEHQSSLVRYFWHLSRVCMFGFYGDDGVAYRQCYRAAKSAIKVSDVTQVQCRYVHHVVLLALLQVHAAGPWYPYFRLPGYRTYNVIR